MRASRITGGLCAVAPYRAGRDPYAAWRDMDVAFLLDTSRTDLRTGSASITEVRSAIGSGVMSGSGIALDMVNTLGGVPALSIPANKTAALRSLVGGTGGASLAPWSISLLVGTATYSDANCPYVPFAYFGRGEGGTQRAYITALGLWSSSARKLGIIGPPGGNAYRTWVTAMASTFGPNLLQFVFDGDSLNTFLDGTFESTTTIIPGLGWTLDAGFGLGTPYPTLAYNWNPAWRLHRGGWFREALSVQATGDRRKQARDARGALSLVGRLSPSHWRASGDSITYGYGLADRATEAWCQVAIAAINAGRYEVATLDNGGGNGLKASERAAYSKTDVGGGGACMRASRPRARSQIHTTALGINDLRTGRTVEQVTADLATIVANALTYGYDKTAIATLTPDFGGGNPGSPTPNALETARLAVNAWIRTTGASLPGVRAVLDFDALPGAYTAANYPDTIHPSAEFHATMGAYAAGIVGPLMT